MIGEIMRPEQALFFRRRRHEIDVAVGADARAFVTQRPWLSESVQVTVDDAADPHPYWLVSSRRPAQLAAAIETARAQAAS